MREGPWVLSSQRPLNHAVMSHDLSAMTSARTQVFDRTVWSMIELCPTPSAAIRQQSTIRAAKRASGAACESPDLTARSSAAVGRGKTVMVMPSARQPPDFSTRTRITKEDPPQGTGLAG